MLQELKSLPQWVNWKFENKYGRKTKIPKNPKTGGNAQTNNTSTWASYELALSQADKYDGIGFMFDNGICGIDLDNKDNNPQIEEQAQTIIQLMDTYTEPSPSGTGYHIIFKCNLEKIPQINGKLAPEYYQKNPHNGAECYFSGLTNRYFTFTDKPLNDKGIEDRTEQILIFLERYMKKVKTLKESDGSSQDNDVLDFMRKEKNAQKFINLYDHGNISVYNNDRSVADMALCNKLAIYCKGDSGQIDRLFRRSALYREKWEREDYRTNTINKAIALYTGTPSKTKKDKKKQPPELQTKHVTIENLAKYLQDQGIKLRYNIINRTTDIQGLDSKYSTEHATDILPTIVYDKLKFIYDKCPKGDIKEYLSVIASTNRYNPVLDMLSDSTWDGQDRLPELFSILGIKDDDRLSKTLVYKWLWQCLSMAKNELSNAYGSDGILVLQGNQGIGKTSFVRKMAVNPELCHIGKSLDFRDKDTLRRCGSNWIVELGEIETTFKSDKEKLKAFITDETDLYRLPYGSADIHLARRTSFIGTCNSTEYLIDETGNRRFWTVPVHKIDLESLAKFDSLQLWLQVDLKISHNRQGFRLTPDEQAMLTKRNSVHEKPLKGEPEVRDILNIAERNKKDISFKKVTVTEFKQAHEALKAYSVQQISQALNKIGISEAIPQKVNGKTQRLRPLPMWNISRHAH